MALPKVLRITHSTDNTTIVNNDQIVTVKDIAIDGILADLASVRGQIGNAKEMPDLDFDTLTTPGNYRITGYPTNGPSLPLNISGASIGSLIVAGIPGQNGHIFQIMISGSVITWRTILTSTGETWSAWQQLLSANKVGDGIRVTNGIISVPEYEGATASKAGTSGLVPPATAGQHESFLTGGGEYKPALTKISDSVTSEDSTTTASAKAVKTAYDLASAALPKSGGTISGNISVVGGITVAAPDGKSEGGQILLKNGTDGSYPVVIDTTNNQIRFFGGPGDVVHVDLETGKFVGNLTGKADSAHLADNTYSLAGRPWLDSLYTDSPGWVIGSVDEKLRPINTGSLKVLAANHIISDSFTYGRTSTGFNLPNGDSWFVFCILDNDLSHSSVNATPVFAAGGTRLNWNFNGTGYTWVGIKVL